MLMLKSLIAWLVILGLAVANGVLRESVLVPSLGKPIGLGLSGVLLSMAVALVAYVFVRLMKGFSVADGLRIGVLWLLLTLAFEFGFGRYVQHKSWAELLDAYAFTGGNIWPLVLLVTLLAPAAVAMLCAKPARPERSG